MQIPKLNAVFPNKQKWPVKKISELDLYISDGNYGELYPTSDQMMNSGVPFIRANNIKPPHLVWDDMKYISSELHSILKSGHLKPADVLVTTRGDIGQVAFVDNKFDGANINAQICLLRTTDQNKINSRFLLQQLASPFCQKQFKELQTGSALKQLPKKNLGQVLIQFPTIEEQNQISSFLSLFDEKIFTLTKKHEHLVAYKNGVMQKIFNQEIKFKDDDGTSYPDWEHDTLGAICKITTGKLDANAMVDGGEYRFYTCAKQYFQIDNYAFDTDALLISGNGANVGYIHHYKGKFNAYQRTYVLDKFSQDIFYMKYFLDQFLPKRIASEKNEGNTPYIVMGTLSEMLIRLPSIAEQQKIASFLLTLDQKISNVQNQLDLTKRFKQGLLQQMFI